VAEEKILTRFPAQFKILLPTVMASLQDYSSSLDEFEATGVMRDFVRYHPRPWRKARSEDSREKVYNEVFSKLALACGRKTAFIRRHLTIHCAIRAAAGLLFQLVTLVVAENTFDSDAFLDLFVHSESSIRSCLKLVKDVLLLSAEVPMRVPFYPNLGIDNIANESDGIPMETLELFETVRNSNELAIGVGALMRDLGSSEAEVRRDYLEELIGGHAGGIVDVTLADYPNVDGHEYDIAHAFMFKIISNLLDREMDKDGVPAEPMKKTRVNSGKRKLSAHNEATANSTHKKYMKISRKWREIKGILTETQKQEAGIEASLVVAVFPYAQV